MVQDTVEKPVHEEKSMAALAEILREHGASTLDYVVVETSSRPAISFTCENEFKAQELKSEVLRQGYPLLSLSYGVGKRIESHWRMTFSTSS